MQRDMDLVRNILLKIEAGKNVAMNDLSKTACTNEDKLGYHIKMLVNEACLLTGIDVSSCDGPEWIHLDLTWHGHEFLDSVRDPEIWRRTKEGAAKIGSFSIETFAELAKGFIKTKIRQHTGVTVA